MRAKYQDNLEMLQWIKRYFDLNYNGAPYDAIERRKGATLYLIAGCGETNLGSNFNTQVAAAAHKTTSTAEKQPKKSDITPSSGSSSGGLGVRK